MNRIVRKTGRWMICTLKSTPNRPNRPSHKGIRPQRLNWGMEGVWEGTFLVAEDGELGGFSNMFDYHP